MNILFLTYGNICNIKEHGIYTDLLRALLSQNVVYTISPKYGSVENVFTDNLHQVFLDFNTGRAGSNFVKKGISTLLTDRVYLKAFKQYFGDAKIDLLIYTTPPITFTSTISYIKKRCNAKTYLLLKDIFPQNAVDISIMRKTGLKGLLYKHFRRQEKKLYAISDRIGCMSQANVDYVIKHNPEIDQSIVEVCPNSIDAIDKSVDAETRKLIREKYGIPLEKKVFVYGGNLGKPQSIPFLIECLKKCRDIEDAYFLIVGDGTEYHLISEYVEQNRPANVKLMKRLPKEDYDTMVGACDVGLIFLDHRFSIPNFPSRLLAYMQAKLPVLAATDPSTDIGKVITDGGFGWWCESNNSKVFYELVQSAVCSSTVAMADKEWAYLLKHYSVAQSVDIIMKHV